MPRINRGDDIAYGRRYRAEHPDRCKISRVAFRYSISREEAQRLISSPCGICGKSGPSEIDHDHLCSNCGFYNEATPRRPRRTICNKCGELLRIRGSLCRTHNVVAGMIQKYAGAELRKICDWVGVRA